MLQDPKTGQNITVMQTTVISIIQHARNVTNKESHGSHNKFIAQATATPTKIIILPIDFLCSLYHFFILFTALQVLANQLYYFI